MDYAAMLRSLAKEVGINVPENAFQKTGESLTNPTARESVSRCPQCGNSRTSIGWCRPCDTGRLKGNFELWTSGNLELDTFIRETQLNANTPFDYMQWIPFDSFTDLQFIAKGGFGSVFSANSESWGKVALKFLDNSDNLTQDFLDELRAHHRCSLGSGIIDCYGVSQDPETGRYVMAMRFADHGNLRRYLSQYYADLSWDEKIQLFDHVTKGLKEIHDEGLVHRDFHSGNILRHEKLVYVTDLGMCRPVNEPEDAKKIYGVLPYVAPEVLRGGKYTQAADIYSLGMIMWEMSSNEPPFADRAHDYLLARDICNGLRPSIIEGTPRGYVAAMLRCWDADPNKRPTTSDLLAVSYKWRFLSDGKAPFTGPKSTKRVKTHHLPKANVSSNNTVHPQAFYTSRLLHYPNLPEPRNSDTFTLFNPQTGDTHAMVRKQSSSRTQSTSVRSVVKDSIHENTRLQNDSRSDKGKERAQDSHPAQQYKTRDSQRGYILANEIPRGRSLGELQRSSTLGHVDKEMLEKLKSDRRRIPSLRWSMVINDVPNQVEVRRTDGEKEKIQ
ncbi:hypothetical protein G9A89_008530 [Geosiphon pyriformis]|nr:hypothetical protein G9A89_008530 [Geosiphon pyriformis]